MNKKPSPNELIKIYWNSEHLQLPDSALALIEYMGVEGAIKLIEAHGGTRKHIPYRHSLIKQNQHWLVDLVGLEAAQALCEFRGGEQMNIPRCPNLARQMAVALYREGETVASLARRFGRIERTIYNWIAQADAQRGGAQLDLFEEVEG